MGKEKNICTTIRKFCTSIRIFQKSCCFFLMLVLRTPFYHLSVGKKDFPLLSNISPDNVGWYQNAEAQHGLGGACNMTVCAPGSDCIFSQHIHMLTPGLPVFFSAAPTWFPWNCPSPGDGTRPKVPLSGHLAGCLVRARKFICLHAFCSHLSACDILQQDQGQRGQYEFPCELAFTSSTTVRSWWRSMSRLKLR